MPTRQLVSIEWLMQNGENGMHWNPTAAMSDAANSNDMFDSLDTTTTRQPTQPSGQTSLPPLSADGARGFEALNTLEVTPLPNVSGGSTAGSAVAANANDVAVAPVNNRKKPRGQYKTFEERVADLRTYKAKHGHTNVKHTEDKRLAQFCSATRHARKNLHKFKQGKGRAKLDEERIAALDAIGFDWKAGSSSSSSSSNEETLTPTNTLPIVNPNVVTNQTNMMLAQRFVNAAAAHHPAFDHSMSFDEEDLVYL